jgi:hypothetical protein
MRLEFIRTSAAATVCDQLLLNQKSRSASGSRLYFGRPTEYH